jgi:uncharacterized membrane protein YkoI
MLFLSFLLAGCATHRFPPQTANEVRRMGAEDAIEVTLTRGGRLAEVEFHVAAASLPAGVLRAMDEQVTGGEIVDAEVEYIAGRVYYEVAKRVGGRTTEILFDEEGRPSQWEIEVAPEAAPKAVLDAADRSCPGGTVRSVEEIRDAGRHLLAYHVKKEDGGLRYKVEIGPAGQVLVVLREVAAEIEVPID